MEEGNKFERLKKTHSDELEQLRQEEKALRKTISSLESQIESWDESKRKRAIVKEIQGEQRRLESVRDVLRHSREENRMLVNKSKAILDTLDDRNVYRTDHSGRGLTSILVGRIEGEKFVWHKPYLDMFGDPNYKKESGEAMKMEEGKR